MIPVVAWIPAVLGAIWSGLVAITKWTVDHYHIVKIVLVCTLIITAFWLGRKVYILFNTALQEYFSDMAGVVPQSPSGVASFLAKANYVLPITEMFALLSVYIVFAGLCLSVKFLISGYKAIPFKNA